MLTKLRKTTFFFLALKENLIQNPSNNVKERGRKLKDAIEIVEELFRASVNKMKMWQEEEFSGKFNYNGNGNEGQQSILERSRSVLPLTLTELLLFGESSEKRQSY